MQIKYRFSINGTSVNPIYGEGLLKEYTREPNERFFRSKLSGKLTFVRQDFDFLNDQPFETEFILLIEKGDGYTWAEYMKGRFYKTNVEWDLDDRKAVVSIDENDQYDKILSGLDKEYNLAKLPVERKPLTIFKRPLIQTYVPGENVVGCFLAGLAWEQEVNDPITDPNLLTNTYHFAEAQSLYKLTISGTGTPEGVRGEYTGSTPLADMEQPEGVYKIEFPNCNIYTLDVNHDKDSSDIGSVWESSNGSKWQITNIIDSTQLEVGQHRNASFLAPPPDTLTHVRNATNTADLNYTAVQLLSVSRIYAVIRISDDAIMFYSKEAYPSTFIGRTGIEFLPEEGSGTVIGDESSSPVYMRYLSDVDTFNGSPTNDIPDPDIVKNNRNYRKVSPYAGVDQISTSARAQDDPTIYGLNEQGRYFLPPDDVTKYYPIARSTWGTVSTWFNFTNFDKGLEVSGRKELILRDAAPINGILKALLNEIDPTITHEATTDYSLFLYDDRNPITLDTNFLLMLTAKSNLLAGEYDEPAAKAPITLSEVLSMLKNTYQLYWWVDSSNRLRIEHVDYFKKGGSYSEISVYNADLTVLQNVKNGKALGFNTSKYSYDKQALEERIEFEWMDDVTLGFDGFPIDINSAFVQDGKIERVNVGNYTSDVDYMLLAPENISKDGFCLFAAQEAPANLLNKYDPGNEMGFVLDDDNGQTIANASYNTSAFMPIASLGFLITISPFFRIAYYTGSYVYMSQEQSNEAQIETYAKPSGAEFFKISSSLTNWENLEVVYGATLEKTTVLPFVTKTVEGAELELQNGFASFIYMHPNFWVYDLPSYDVDINEGEAVTVEGVKRTKEQTVYYPSVDDPDPLKLVKTYIGEGEIEKLSVNLSSRMNKLTLRYDTE